MKGLSEQSRSSPASRCQPPHSSLYFILADEGPDKAPQAVLHCPSVLFMSN